MGRLLESLCANEGAYVRNNPAVDEMVNLMIPKVLTQVKKSDLPDSYVIEVMKLAATVLKMVHLLSQHMTDDDTQA